MSDRFPLIVNPSTGRIEELAAGDNLNLTNNSIVGASTVTASTFVGNLTGTSDIAISLTDAGNILAGNLDPARLDGYYNIGVGTANNLTSAANIQSGTIDPARLTGDYDINIAGLAASATSLVSAENILDGIISADRLTGTYDINITGTAFNAVGAASSVAVVSTNDFETYYIPFFRYYDSDDTPNVDTSSLVYNPGLNRLGIGSTSPTVSLDVIGDINASGYGRYSTIQATNLTISGITTSEFIRSTLINNSGIATVGSLSIGSTQVVSNLRQLQNILSIDETTKTTLEVALELEPNNFNSLNVSGIGTFSGILNADGGLDVLGHTDLDTVTVASAATITSATITSTDTQTLVVSAGSSVGSLSIGSTQVISSSRGLQNIVSIDETTRSTLESALELEPNNFNSLNVSGVGTFSGKVDLDGGVEVNGQSTLENLNVTGVGTIATINNTNANISGIATINTISSTNTSVSGTSTVGTLNATTASIGSASITESTVGDIQVSGAATVSGYASISGSVDIGSGLDVTGQTELDNVNAGVVTATSVYGNGVNLVGIVTQIAAGIGIDLVSSQSSGKGVVEVTSYKPIGKTIFVSQTGSDSNTGLSENHPKKTIKAAAALAFPGDTIKVYPGVYVENNPIVLSKNVSVEGTELRNCVVTPRYTNRDLFHVNNSCHVTDLSFIGPDMTDGAAIIAFQPLLGVSTDRFFDAARLLRLNLDYIAKESVGFLTSGFSGFAGNHREQDAARLIDLNIDFIAAEAIGFLTSTDYKSPAFTVVNSSGIATDPVNCSDDIKDILRSISYDLKAGSNRKSIGAGLSYYDNGGTLLHITGTDLNGYSVKEATIAAINHAVGIVTHVINNISYGGTTYSGLAQDTSSYSPVLVSGGCTDTIQTIESLAGIVTSILGNFNNAAGITTVYGVTLESKDCADDVKDIWKCVIHDITRGGNSRCVAAGKSYYDGDWNLIPQILKNPGEVEQTIATVDYSFGIARAIINNSTWGGFPVSLGTTVSAAQYDYRTGVTTVTATNHGLSKDDAVKIQNLTFECAENSPGESVGVVTASYDRVSGITTIQTSSALSISSGNRVKLENLVWECDSGGGPSTAFFPSGNYRYDFTVIDVINSNTFSINVGTSTLPHTYVTGGSAARVYTPSFGISTASYDETTGITTVSIVGLGTNTDPVVFIEPGQKVKLENLVWECDSGGGPSTAFFPSGANGYDFTVISTVADRYFDASNLIEANKVEIIDKSLGAIAIAHSDFYYPNDVQTTRFSRFKDSYRLIQQNRTEIVNSAWNATVSAYPGISTTQTKCKRDIGYFIDAISTDIFTGGNSYAIAFVNQYFNNGAPIANGLVGEETESNYAFNQARDLMKQAITNQLTIKDLTVTADPETGSNTDPDSCANVQNAIDTLTSIVTTVITNGSLNSLNSIIVNRGIFTTGENKCRRDIGFIVDALIKDVRYGTNKYIREATRAYFNANGSPISNGLVGEEAQSVTAFNAIRDYAKLAINNLLNNKDLSITADPLTGFNTDPLSCADVRSNIDNLIAILTTTISNGNLSSFPSLYVSNQIKVNVGVSTIAHTYVDGGTLVANYTTEIFPDGTFGYIFPVKRVINNNTFEFVGGKTVIDHTYVSGGTIQKYGNFQNQFTQVKDLGIQTDPQTGFNNAINGCANVVSAIRSCVGVVTTIVGLGASSGITTSYPGNRGLGATNTAGIITASYNNSTGIVNVIAPEIDVKEGDIIEMRDLLFECASGVTTSTQLFPSGKYGYNFYVDEVYPNGSFDVSVGISTIPHTYVSGGEIVNRAINVTEAYYDHTTGITTIVAPGSSLRVGDIISVRGLEFSCSSGAGTTTIYPSGNNGYDFPVLSVVGFGNTFTINTGVSTIAHSYVAGGIIIPPYSPGVGPITQGPYIRNCTNFVPKSIGMKIDGFAAEPGDQNDIGVTGSMSVDSYTQYNQGGIGVSISNGAYAQLVSIFTICNDIAIYTESGGQCDITNSNSSFGRLGLVADGVGDAGSKSIYRSTGVAVTEVSQGNNIVTVSGVGTYRPYDGQVCYFGTLYKFVDTIEITNGGSGYTIAPRVTLSVPEGENGITAQASSVIENGRVVAINIVNSGSQYESAPTITIDPPTSGTTATAEVSSMQPIYYKVDSATLPVAGISTISLVQTLNNTVSAGTTVYFTRVSLQITSSHSFEWVGSGNDINTAKPALGGVAIPENEVIQSNGGLVVYTSTDQAGNFRIGDGVAINQATGQISGRDFTKALFTTMTPFILALAD